MTVLNFHANPQQVSELLKELKASGTNVGSKSPTEFSLDGHGIKANVTYTDPTLTVTILSKPFYVPASAIQNGISVALDKALASEQLKQV